MKLHYSTSFENSKTEQTPIQGPISWSKDVSKFPQVQATPRRINMGKFVRNLTNLLQPSSA